MEQLLKFKTFNYLPPGLNFSLIMVWITPQSLYLSVNLYLIQFVTWGRSKRICCRLIEAAAWAGLFLYSESAIQQHSDFEPPGQLDLNRRAINKKVKIQARKLEWGRCQLDGSLCTG